MATPAVCYFRLFNLLTMATPAVCYFRLFNLLTMATPAACYFRLFNLLTIATPAVCYFRNASCSLNKKSMFLYDYNKLYCLKTFLLNFSVLVLTFSGGRSFMHQTSVILKGLFIYM